MSVAKDANVTRAPRRRVKETERGDKTQAYGRMGVS
jgi:hypothetical protein